MAADRRRFGPGPYVRGLSLDEHAAVGGAFWGSLGVVRHLDRLDLSGPVTFIVGENGTGKSTFIEALAAALRFSPLGGELDPGPDRDWGGLGAALVIEDGPCKPRGGWFLRAESFFTVAASLDRDGPEEIYGGVRLHEQSHGESFLALAANRFGPDGLYVLDEPEAALSLQSALAFLATMRGAVARGAQFIIATHSPILLAYPGAAIYELDRDGPPERVAYDAADPVRLTRSFLDAPEAFLRHVFEE